MKFSLCDSRVIECRNVTSSSFSCVSINSGDIPENAIFCALQGEHTNGHLFVEDAIRKGALAALVSRDQVKDSWKDLPLLIAEDSLKGLQALASDYLKHIKVPVFAITGSVGKTSTRRLLHHVLSPHMTVYQTSKNYNNQIGLPLSILEMTGSEDLAILEMGASYEGDIKELCSIAAPDYAVLTAIAPAHMGKFGSIEAIQKTKFEIYDAVPLEGILFVNHDDARVAAYPKDERKRVSYGINTPSDHTLSIIDTDSMGCHTLSDGRSDISLKTPGHGAAINAAAVYAVAFEFNIPYGAMIASLSSYMPERGRGFYETWQDILIIDDTYNANPASTENALRSLAKMKIKGKKYFIFADMLEMGSSSHSEHEKIGRLAADTDIDVLYCYGPESLFTVQAAQDAGIGEACHFMDKNELGKKLASRLRPGDAVHLKGSRGMAMETIITFIKDQ